MADISLARAATLPSAARSGFALCAFTLLCAVFLQKIALPGTGGLYPLSLFIFPATTIAAFLGGVLEINRTAFVWYSFFVLMGALCTVLSPSPHVSVLSLGFLVVAQFPLVFRNVSSDISYRRVIDFLSMVGCVSALIGVFQFMGQFAFGVDAAFFV